MKKLTILFLTFFVLAASSCKKDSSTSGDLTTDIVGFYQSGTGSGHVEVTVTKVNNNTVSIAIGPYDASLHSNSTMSSKTSFTLSEYSKTESGIRTTYTGSGTASNNNIAISLHRKEVEVSSGTIYDESDEIITASK